MQQYEFNIVIIGGGCIGSSILYELSKRGVNNIALLDHGRTTTSATTHSGGMIRVFHENIEHLELALNNLSFIEKYQRSHTLTENSIKNGNLYFFNKKRYGDYIKHLVRMDKAHYPYALLTDESGQQQFPQYDWHKRWAIYEPTAYSLMPQTYMNDLLFASQSLGATLLDNIKVQRISTYSNRYRLSSENAVITAKLLILAGGAQLLPRLQDLSLQLPFTKRKITTYIATRIDTNETLPNYFDRELLQFGCFNRKDTVTLSHLNNKQLLEKKWGDIINKQSAYDLYTPKRLGFLGRVAGFQGLFLATGWGGTAFKFALEIAHRMSNIIEVNYKNGIAI